MDMVVELRKLEGINTSFDYGVEIVVMGVKQDPSLQNFDAIMSETEIQLAGLFEFDKVVKRGFSVAKETVEDQIMFLMKYIDFIREFKHDETTYAMRSEPKILIFAGNRGTIWKNREIEEMSELLKSNGFDFKYEELRNGDIEFEVIPRR